MCCFDVEYANGKTKMFFKKILVLPFADSTSKQHIIKYYHSRFIIMLPIYCRLSMLCNVALSLVFALTDQAYLRGTFRRKRLLDDQSS